ncbi:Type I restriction-modification system, specificity subunit S [Methanosarcina siciliae T4/M]|uniref:Type I restriction-modification system, specificity subunit S n=1 Tax=Methanosarcina siciliae T4/M TaxID=1434120 RepID=A0A0E3P3T0_9EURY|nr:restriction endonuclease subunit S [Methanosarcina siciliae]AKB28173.1 Type I restriction-modification system, specificity subunit S [Methanosarcina siciliae T4/M]
MSATFVKLGSVAEFINGVAFKPEDWGDSGTKIIRIQNLTDSTKPFNRTNRTVSDKYHVRPHDLLVSWSATLGVFEWFGPDEALLNQHIFRVLPDENKVEKRYLRYALEGALLDMQRHLHGATMQHVNRGEFLNTKLFLPSLPDQERIADILDRAEALRAKRRAALSQLDELVQSIFIDMFGDPLKNPKEWQQVQLGDLIFSASDGPHVSPPYTEAGIPFLSTRHVRAGEIIWEDLKFISQEDAEIQWKKCKPERGDILYTKGGTTGLAATVQTDQPFAIWVHVSLLKPDPQKVDSIWLESMLNNEFCYRQSQVLTHGIANRDLGLTRMVKIKMFLPPISLQKDFALRVVALQKLKTQHEASLTELDELFASLQYRAFRGEL